MLRADRNKKAATKALAEAAAQPGQSRITSTFTRASGDDTNDLSVCARIERGTSENQMRVDDNITIQETWINCAGNYTDPDK